MANNRQTFLEYFLSSSVIGYNPSKFLFSTAILASFQDADSQIIELLNSNTMRSNYKKHFIFKCIYIFNRNIHYTLPYHLPFHHNPEMSKETRNRLHFFTPCFITNEGNSLFKLN